MNEELLQGQSLNYDHQGNKEQDNMQNQTDELAFNLDRSLNLNNSINFVQISNDEKYLITLKGRRKIQIYDFKNKKLIKNLQLDGPQERIHTLKFSNNQKYLLFGDSQGWLGCFDINSNYKLIYNQRVHSKSINDLQIIDEDQVLTCSTDRSLIITNRKNDQQLLKIENAHTEMIERVEFHKSKDFIISCSSDCSIKFFNRKDGKLEIEQQDAHETIFNGLYMIQLILEDNNLISISEEEIRIWLIDYQSLKLLKLKEYNNKIYNFTSVFNNKIIVICSKFVPLLDKDLVEVQSIYHNLMHNQSIYNI